jgi:hypothetical protein
MTGPVPGRSSYRLLVIVGATGERITRVSVAARAVHRAVLQAFAVTGAPPGRPDLVLAAGGADPDRLLAELHEHDVIRLDERGAIRAAYPFSARPTAHVVDIDGGPSVYAMCAVDALGMSAMLHRRVVIHSAEPDTGAAITVTVHTGRSTWSPRTTVVVVGGAHSASACDPPNGRGADGAAVARLGAAADIGCAAMNFFTHPDRAAGWLAVHPEVTGEVLSRKRALRLGVSLFSHLLDR